MFVKAIYKKSPAVAANIHKFTSSISPIKIPRISPIKQEQAERKLANSADLTVIPDDNNTAKSPSNWEKIYKIVIYCSMNNWIT